MTPRAISALGIGQCVNWGVLYYAFAVLLQPVQRELGAPTWAVAGAFSTALLVAAVLAPAVGRWCDHGRGPSLMRMGGVAAATALVGWTMLPGLIGLYAAWLALGVCMATTLYEPAFAVLTHAHADPAARLRAIAVVTLFGGVASTVFLPLTATLVDSLGWRGAVRALAGLMVLSAAVTSWAVSRLPGASEADAAIHPASHHETRTSGEVSSSRVRVLQALFGTASLAGAAFTANLVPALGERGASPRTAALLGGLFGVLQLPSRAMLMSPRFAASPFTLIAISFGLQSAGLVVVATASGSAALAAGVTLFAIGAGLTILTRPYAVQALFPIQRAGHVNGRLARAQQTMRAVGPVAVAMAAGVTSYALVLAGLAGLLALVAVIAVRRD